MAAMLARVIHISSKQQMPAARARAPPLAVLVTHYALCVCGLFHDRRKKTQPVTERTAGCVFRNPGGGPSAGALIDQAGLKGLAVGDARVSEVHANFFVNAGNSKSSDMLSLIAQVKERVRDVSGVELKEEIVLVPYAAAIHAT